MNQVKIISSSYERSDSIIVQGTQRKIGDYEKQGYYKHHGGNGTYVMKKPATAKITFDYNGKTYTQSVKELIKEMNDESKVTKKQFEEFVKNCKDGNIDLKYNTNQGLYI